MKCRKCHSENLVMRPNAKNPSATELICGDCGTWQKFIGKEEIRIFEIKAALKSRPTNADRIRGMSDEALAEWILRLVDCDKENVMCNPTEYKLSGKCNGRCLQGWLDWLGAPAETEGTE